MNKISLALYSVEIREKNKSKTLDIKDFDTNGHSFYHLFKEYLKWIKKINVNTETERAVQIDSSFLDDENESVNGIIQTGDYGYETKLVDIYDDSKNLERKKNHAELRPFYYSCSLKDGEFILALQRFSQYGISKLLMESFSNFLKEKKKNKYSVYFLPLAPEGLIDKYKKKGVIKSIRFKRFLQSSDIVDMLDSQKSKEQEVEGTLIVTFIPKKNSFFSIKKDKELASLTQRGLTRQVKILRETGMEGANDISVDMQIDDSIKKINLTSPNKIRSYYDITKDVEMGKNGHPTLKSIDKIAKEIIKNMKL